MSHEGGGEDLGTWLPPLDDPRRRLLREIGASRRLLHALEENAVRAARREGWSWREIAEELGVTAQAVHRRFSAEDPAAARRRTRKAARARAPY